VAPLSHYINYLELFTYFPSFRPQVQILWTLKIIFVLFTRVKKQYMETLIFSFLKSRNMRRDGILIYILGLSVF